MKEFAQWVLDAASAHGWMALAASGPGLLLVHDDPCRLIIAALKSDGEVLDSRLADFLRRARAVADDCELGASLHPGQAMGEDKPLGVYVWHPADRAAIETILRSKVLS